MKKIICAIPILLQFICFMPGQALAVNTRSNKDDGDLIFVNPNVAIQVIREYFGRFASVVMQQTNFYTTMANDYILRSVLVKYNQMLKQNGGLVSANQIKTVCDEAFKTISVDNANKINLHKYSIEYCKKFTTSLILTETLASDDCRYEVSKVNNSQMKIRYKRKDGTGFYRIGGTIAWRFWNPGALRRSSLQCSQINTNPNGIFAVFDSYETGRKALHDLLRGPVYNNQTVKQAIYIYAPPKENNTTRYVNIIKSKGVNVNRKLSELTETELEYLIDVIEMIEGWHTSGTIQEF